MTVGDYLAAGLAADAGAPALVEDGQAWSYAETARLVAGCAGLLQAQGVTSGGRVGVYGFSGVRAVVVMLAAWRLGAAYVGLSPKHTARELAHVLADARTQVVVDLVDRQDPVREQLAVALESVGASAGPRIVLSGANWAGACLGSEASEPAPVLPESTAVVLYTSGSTGSPKGVVLSHTAVRGGVEVIAELVVPPVRCLTDYPVNHVSWVIETTLLTLSCGGTLHLRPRFDASETLALIEQAALTVWQGAPSMFSLCMAEADFAGRDLSSVDSVLYFGGPLSAADLRTLHERTDGARVATGWGMTETAGGVTLSRPDDPLETVASTVGAPHASAELLLVDHQGTLVPAGEVGEILVRSPYLFDGYLDRPESTAEVLDERGFLHTGDLAVLLDDGCLRLVGRRREMYKSGGYNVFPGEVELVLQDHPGVAAAAVVAVPDPLWGEVGVAFVQGVAGAAPPDLGSVREHCRTTLANYKIPKRVIHVELLPVSATGKVDRAALRANITPIEEEPPS